MNPEKLKVHRRAFARWILEDAEDFYNNKETIINGLIDNTLTLETLFNQAGCIPHFLIDEILLNDDAKFKPNVDCYLGKAK